MTVRVQDAPFALGDELEAFAAGRTDMGAIVSFTGVVRDLAQGDLDVMEIEHYPGMTERAIAKIVDEARQRWSLGDALVIHRYGRMGPGDRIMMVATAAPHRVDAFAAAEFLMDYLKSRAPFWKKEISGDTAGWVEATSEDEAALKRW